MHKHPEEFGHGAIEGVAGPEAANNASVGGAFIPLLSLGIPGPIVKKLEEVFLTAYNEPEFKKKAKELELPLYYLESKAHSEYLRSLDGSYRALWAEQPWVK